MIALHESSFLCPAMNATHHKRAYQALWQSLAKLFDSLERRQQLDLWLMQHGHPLADGELWEQEFSQSTYGWAFDWRKEYLAVIRFALRGGYFYSDAFQKQLYHAYIETERLSLAEQELLHHKALTTESLHQPVKQPMTRSVWQWLGCLFVTVPFVKYFWG